MSGISTTRIIIFIIILIIVVIALFSLNVLFTIAETAVGIVISILSFGLLIPGSLGMIIGGTLFNITAFIVGTYLTMWLVSMIMTWPVYMWGGWIGWNLIWPVPWIWRIFSGHMLGEKQ